MKRFPSAVVKKTVSVFLSMLIVLSAVACGLQSAAASGPTITVSGSLGEVIPPMICYDRNVFVTINNVPECYKYEFGYDYPSNLYPDNPYGRPTRVSAGGGLDDYPSPTIKLSPINVAWDTRYPVISASFTMTVDLKLLNENENVTQEYHFDVPLTSCYDAHYDEWVANWSLAPEEMAYGTFTGINYCVDGRIVQAEEYADRYGGSNLDNLCSGYAPVSYYTPSKTGYQFLGWSKDPDAIAASIHGGDSIYHNHTYIILHAIYRPEVYTIRFDANGGACSTQRKTVTFDSAYGTLPVPTWEGHTFSGWYTSPSGGMKVTEDAIVAIASDNMLYAHWDKDPTPMTKLELKSLPKKTTYIAGEDFDPYGLTLKATYADGHTSEIMSGIVCTGYNPDMTGAQTITAAYGDKKTTFFVSVVPALDYARGSIMLFGSYPQSRVTDTALLDALNAQNGAWKSYGYYSGSGSRDGTMQPSDYMRYKDVTYKGSKYRAVTFDNYRPERTSYQLWSDFGPQRESGFSIDTVYWFRWDPLEWRILDPVKGLVLCESIPDSQPYTSYILYSGEYWGDAEKTYYANDYAHSSIRQWLNADFYNAAFTASQKAQIPLTVLDNSDAEEYFHSSEPTQDKIFLLSWQEAQNAAYGFDPYTGYDDPARQTGTTEYALCQGFMERNYSGWRLRSAGDRSDTVCFVHPVGSMYSYDDVDNTSCGIRPAMRVYPDPEDVVVLTGVSVQSLPDKTVYTADQSFDPTGLTLTATYSDGSTRTITRGFWCTGYDTRNFGEQTITAAYCGKTTTFSVSLKHKILQSIEVSAEPDKTVFIVGECFDPTGLVLRAYYDNGTSKWIGDGFTCTGFDPDTVGEQTVTVWYAGKSTTFSVSVIPDVPTSIEVESLPVKTTYFSGERFDPTGLTLRATYVDGVTTRTITSGFDLYEIVFSWTHETQLIDVWYKGLETTFSIDYVSATYSGQCGSGVNWSLNTDVGLLSVTGTGAMTNYASSDSTPWKNYRSSIQTVSVGSGVTSVGSYAFSGCSNLSGVTIADSVMSIGNSAFSECNLASVTIPDSVTSIGSNAFGFCYNLASVTIGNSVTSIGSSAFYCDDRLESVTIPDSVTSIGSSAFYCCTSLVSVMIGNGVTTIGSRAFNYCCNLERITIPNSVTTIGEDAFDECDDLSDVYYHGTEAEWRAISIGSGNTDLRDAPNIYFLTSADVTLSKIEICSLPHKTAYCLHETFDPTGLTLTATYSDGSTRTVTDGFSDLHIVFDALGVQTVSVNYEYRTVTFTVSVDPRPVMRADATLETPQVGDVLRSDLLPVHWDSSVYSVSVSDLYYENGSSQVYLHAGDKFAEGIQYHAVLCFTVQSGEAFDPSATQFFVNGEPAAKTDTAGKQQWVDYAFTVGAVDPDMPVFSMAAARCAPGKTVTIPVTISQNPGICTAKLTVDYDTDILELVRAENGQVMPDDRFTPGGNVAATPYSVLWNSSAGTTDANGTIVTFTFRVKEDAPVGSQTTVSLNYAYKDTLDADLEPVTFRTESGNLTVLKPRIAGDVNDDGVVSLKDTVLICRYLAGNWNVEINTENADVDGSCDVSMRDVVLIERFLAGGWNVELI